MSNKVKSVKFNVGDRVKIVKKVTTRTPDFQNGWVDRMLDTIGRIVTIRKVHYTGIYFNEVPLGYPPASLVKVGFSSFDEVINYMKRGGYVIADLLDDDVCYRIRKGILEVNDSSVSSGWDKSFFSPNDIQMGRVTDIHLFTKRKYS